MCKFLKILAVGLLAGCTADGATSPPAADASQSQGAKLQTVSLSPGQTADTPAPSDKSAQLAFLDLSGFDADLSQSMREENREVVVKVPGRFSLNEIPDRMDKWLSRIKESGGKVQAEEIPKDGMQTRGIVGALIDIVVAVYSAAQEHALYAPAENYNVVLRYDAETGKVREAVFYHR